MRYISEIFCALRHGGIARRGVALAGMSCGFVMTLPVYAQDGRLPPREAWPSRTRPTQLRMDGRRIDACATAGVMLRKPLLTLEARW